MGVRLVRYFVPTWVCLAGAMALFCVPAVSQTTIRGEIAAARCDSVRVGAAAAAVTPEGTFEVRVSMDRAAYATLSCGWDLTLFLSPGDDLVITVEAGGAATFEGPGTAPNEYLARTGALVGRSFTRSLLPLVEAHHETFANTWDSLRGVDEAALDSVLASAEIADPFAAMERARIRSVWAHGQLAYPFLHWRDGDADSIRPTPGSRTAAEAVDLDDPALLALPEFREFARAFVHEGARSTLLENPAYRSGDNRWTRAQYDFVIERVSDPGVRDFLLHALLAAHLDRNGSEGLEPLLVQFAGDASDLDLHRQLAAAFEEERKYWEGDRAEPYKTIEGTTLEAHFRRPAATSENPPLPAFVWLHGGSFDTGAWYHCPYVCRAAGEAGMAVISLEQRTADRFVTTPADQLDDVRDALAWVRRNADRLAIDPARVVLGGFSSGGTLALMAAVVHERGTPAPERVPDAAVAIGGCVAPLEGDGWFRKSIAGGGLDPERYSPTHNVRPGAPPILLVHGTADEFCEYATVPSFRNAMERNGSEVHLPTLPGQSHFFLFRSAPARELAMESLVEFLDASGLAETVGGDTR